jgi:hypothetical protein
MGGCALVRERLNPYSEAATLRIQVGMYGRPALPGEDQVAFTYPLFSLLFFLPLCATEDYALVQAIWIWLLLVALVLSAILSLRIIRWHPRSWLWILTILWVVCTYPGFRALILGQFAVIVWLALVAALWALKHQHDGWAGVLLALATVKPQLVYLVVPWILLWAAGQRRWRLWLGFFTAMASLTIGGMLLLPSWLPDFVHQTLAYPSYTVFGSLMWMVVQHTLGLDRTAEMASTIALATVALVLCWRLWRGTWEQMLWMAGLLLLITNFFTPRIATTNYVLLIPWVLWGLRQMQVAWRRWGTWAIVATQAMLMIGPWAVFLATIQGSFEQVPAYFAFPAAAMVMLAWLWMKTRPAAQSTMR